jgi:hypothetical protein
MRPLNDFDVYFVIGLHIQNACHEYLTQRICLKGLEIVMSLDAMVSISFVDEKE